jgi:hypothetical protein
MLLTGYPGRCAFPVAVDIPSAAIALLLSPTVYNIDQRTPSCVNAGLDPNDPNVYG